MTNFDENIEFKFECAKNAADDAVAKIAKAPEKIYWATLDTLVDTAVKLQVLTAATQIVRRGIEADATAEEITDALDRQVEMYCIDALSTSTNPISNALANALAHEWKNATHSDYVGDFTPSRVAKIVAEAKEAK